MMNDTPMERRDESVNPFAWGILGLLFFSSLAAPLHMSKVPPLMGRVMEQFGVGMTTAGWLMAVFSIIGVFLALPTGLILGRFGARITGLAALASMTVGGVLGATATSFGILLVSRMLEGVGLCFMGILAPAVISAWFPPEKRGLPMGIWGTWVAVGTILIFALAPRLAAAWDWRAVWWACTGFSGLLLVLYAVVFRMPPGAEAAVAPDTRAELARMGITLRRRDPWLLAVAFGLYNVILLALSSYLPTFFVQERGFTPAGASSLSGCMMGISIVSVVLGGMLTDKLGTRKWCMIIPCLVMAGILALFFLPGNGVIVTMLTLGFVGGLLITPVFATATEIVPGTETGASLAILAVGQNLGMGLGPVYFAAVVEKAGWMAGAYACVPAMLIAAFCAWRIRVR